MAAVIRNVPEVHSSVLSPGETFRFSYAFPLKTEVIQPQKAIFSKHINWCDVQFMCFQMQSRVTCNVTSIIELLLFFSMLTTVVRSSVQYVLRVQIHAECVLIITSFVSPSLCLIAASQEGAEDDGNPQSHL